ncbi:GNAT family N-acetyltransferase [Mycoplana sp. MJR14]|uniref:GNAT family N-acetyltransferase n=1 Tax=Mycoplana sp. MJR14 TaxID=3032583 RepID=UPI0023DABEC0|nr:GNAT family N-acetyltransferase [Mycoplana sp. MJR14]MDF1631861.1 GNAT family N-acetyltransferase [Mycoplana sp. MJR14]
MQVRPLAQHDMQRDMEAFGRLLSGERSAAHCWCMWFIRRVKDFHAGGAAANRAAFAALGETSPLPLGLLAFDDDEPVGWVAAGPRARYARAVKTPTLKTTDRAEDATVWLVPCLFVRPERRGQAISGVLLAAAVELARQSGATAIEGFPLTGRTGNADRQVGTEALFRRAGFDAIDRPSSNRVVMRLALR